MITTIIRTVANVVDGLAYRMATAAARWRGDPEGLGPIWRPGAK
jgi:hypothetical protein